MGRDVFKFYRSYYDVWEAVTNEQKLEFMDGLLKRQFFGTEPQFDGILKLLYAGQKFLIDKQVKGWERATSQILNPPITLPLGGGGMGTPEELQLEFQIQKELERKQEEVSNLLFEFQQTKIKGAKTQAAMQEFGRLTVDDMKLAIKFAPTFLKNYPKDLYPKKAENYLRDMDWHDAEPEVKRKKNTL